MHYLILSRQKTYFTQNKFKLDYYEKNNAEFLKKILQSLQDELIVFVII